MTTSKGRKPTANTAKGGTKVRRSVKAWTWQAVIACLTKAGDANRGRGVKPYYRSERLAKAIAKATTVPSLTEAKVEITKGSAEDRRKHCRKHRLVAVDVHEIVAKDEITHDRPELTVLSRIGSIAKVMGLPKDTFYAVRAEAYKADEIPKVYIVRR